MKLKRILLMVVALLMTMTFHGCNKENKYQDDNLWAYKEIDKEAEVDTFFLAPAATTGSKETPSLEFDNEKNMSKFKGSVAMQKGIYDTKTRFFAPYYREAFMYVYTLSEEEKNAYLDRAYEDVKEAFEYYLAHFNKGNKIIIAGFSEGADMSLRLLKDFTSKNSFYNKFIACYAIGNLVSDEYLNSHKRLKFAEEELDQKVIISFNCEDPDTTSSLLIKENDKTHCINPLTWTTGYEKADKSMNKGAVFLNTYGEVTSRIEHFTGCYIDEKRGTLKVTDVNKEEYNSMKDFMGDGVFHLYDYQFFYENLKENVIKRIEGK